MLLVICTWLHRGCLSICVRDSLQCSEEIVKNLELCMCVCVCVCVCVYMNTCEREGEREGEGEREWEREMAGQAWPRTKPWQLNYSTGPSQSPVKMTLPRILLRVVVLFSEMTKKSFNISSGDGKLHFYILQTVGEGEKSLITAWVRVSLSPFIQSGTHPG